MTNCKQSQIFIGLTSFVTLFLGTLLFLNTEVFETVRIFRVSVYVILIIVQGILFFITDRHLFRPLSGLRNYLRILAVGKIPEIPAEKLKKFELNSYAYRTANQFRYLKNYAQNLDNSDSTDSFKKMPIILGSVKMIDHFINRLKIDAADWKAKEEKRNWSNQGVAKFSDLLRHGNKSINDLAQEFIRELILYIEGNQGGVFLVDDSNDSKCFEMVAAYAYDRDRYPKKTRAIDDGLLGAVCFEKKSIYITHLPETYLEIRSGMGDAPPTSILLVPLLYDEEVIGVIELASFKKLVKHEIDFVEKIGEVLASTIASVKINHTTSQLLSQSQNQAQELQRQEEELRQNIEEMKAQQDEMEKKQYEVEESKALMSKIIDLVPFPIFVKNISREYIVANQAQARLFNLQADQLLGRTDNDLISDYTELDEILKTDNKVLKENQPVKLPEQSISLPNGERKVMQTIKVPFENNITKNRNILGVSVDYTQQRLLEQKLKESREKVELLAQKAE